MKSIVEKSLSQSYSYTAYRNHIKTLLKEGESTGKSKEPTAILGGRIEFAAENDDSNSKKAASDFTYLSSETKLFLLANK